MKLKLLFVLLLFPIFVIIADAEAYLPDVSAGQPIDVVIPTDSGFTVTSIDIVFSYKLPDNCTVTNQNGTLHLIGNPMNAGDYTFIIRAELKSIQTFDEGALSKNEDYKNEEITCHITVKPDTPTITVQPGNNLQLYNIFVYDTKPEESITLIADGKICDGGTIEYQWYISDDEKCSVCARISGATSKNYIPDAATISGIKYYFCRIYNNNNNVYSYTDTNVVAVNVEKPTVEDVVIYSQPDRLVYEPFDELSMEGFKLNVFYSSGKNEIISEGFDITPITFEKEGVYDIYGEYGGLPFSFKVFVQVGEFVNLSLLSSPFKTSYIVGETLDTFGLALLAETADTVRRIDWGYTCTPTSFNQAGTQTITVKYMDKECSFDVLVREKPYKEENNEDIHERLNNLTQKFDVINENNRSKKILSLENLEKLSKAGGLLLIVIGIFILIRLFLSNISERNDIFDAIKDTLKKH